MLNIPHEYLKMHEENQDKYSFFIEKFLHFRERKLEKAKQIAHNLSEKSLASY